MENYNVVNLFFDAVEKNKECDAIIHMGQKITYGQLYNRVENYASWYSQNGIKKGTKVMVLIPMSIELYASLLALFKLGAIVVFVDEWSSSERIDSCREVVGIDVLLGTTKSILASHFYRGLRRIPKKLKNKVFNLEPVPTANCMATDSALITFTTGSTGNPKAADRTHGFLHAQNEALLPKIKSLGNVAMVTLPIIILCNLGVGITTVIPELNAKKMDRLDAFKLVSDIRKHNVESIIGSPIVAIKLAEFVNGNNDLSLRRIITGGAPVFPSDAKMIKEGLPNCTLEIVYGSTEAEPISSTVIQDDDVQNNEKGLYVGTIDSKTKCKIIKHTNDAIKSISDTEELDEGEIGDIIVAGDHVLQYYYNCNEAMIENKIKAEQFYWHRTGDAGYRIGNKLYLVGRVNEMIPSADGYILPFIIEGRLKDFDDITTGTIVENHEKLVLVVESPKTDLPKEELRKIFGVDEIVVERKLQRDPRHHGKLDYGHIRRQLIKSL